MRILIAALLIGCAHQTVQSRPLYERLGGTPAITAVVDDFLGRVAKDDRINTWFANADMARLRAMLIEQICEASGGPCKYTGRDMLSVHTGMGVTSEAFTATVEDLKASLDGLKVPAAEQKDLLGALAAMKPDIVAAHGGASQAGANDPVFARAHAYRQSAGLLEKAGAARGRGDRSFAEQLFSSAEVLLGAEAVADLAGYFREGAPPRVTTPLVTLPKETPPQPVSAGSSEEDEQPEPRPARGSLAGVLSLPGGAPLEGFAVVTLDPVGGRSRRRQPKHRVIEQRNREFAPKVVAVPVGSTVTFPNFDSIYHNVFSRSEARPFDLGIYKSGQARELAFEKEGVVRIGCNLHANMSAYVVVVSAPHYVITDARGRFSFRSLEPGRYVLKAWSERSEAPVVQELEVRPDRNSVAVTLDPGIRRPVLADKFGAPRAIKAR